MKRITEAWFEFKNIRSDTMGILLRQMPTRTWAALQVERKKIPGRNGTLAYGKPYYADAKAVLECDVQDCGKLNDIAAWLTGNGLLRFSDAPNMAYDASIEKEIQRKSIIQRMEGQRFSVTWTCSPFARLYPEAADIILTQNNALLETEGNAPGQPRIKIEGSGDFSLTIGQQTMFFTGIDGGVVVDSELQDALSLDEAELLNNHVAGQFFEIQPGDQYVSWALETGAQITKITITPRWRCL